MSKKVEMSSEVFQFLKKNKQLLINNQWVEAISGKKFTVENPANGEVVTQVSYAQSEDVDLAVKAARQAFDVGPWKKMHASERSKLLWKMADLIEKHSETFAQLETLDNGKPLKMSRGADVPLTIEMFRYMAGWATKIHGETFPLSVPYTPKTQYSSYTMKEPVGVVAQIIPWNFPLLMAAWKLAPALSAGCTVILKPAEQTPLSALFLGELFLEAGFPAGVVNILTGHGDTGAALVKHAGVDKVAFTGSTEVGKIIMSEAKGNLKRVSLELGGKSPNIIFKDANMKAAIEGAASAIFFNHGQCCCAGSRLFVEKDVYEQVVEGVIKIASNIKLGDGFDLETDMGPLVSREQFDRVSSFIQSGNREGAKAVFGGTVNAKDPGYFVGPTIFTQTNTKMKIYCEEIFGPVLSVIPFSTMEEVASLANDSEYGLAAGIWTQDISKAHSLSKELKAGTTWINCYNIFDAAMPFGGFKQSGHGREMGREVLQQYTETKSVCIAF